MLRDIDGFNLLENECVCDGNVVIHGTRFVSSYYNEKDYEPMDEYVNVMNKNLNYGNDDTFNILLDHSPYRSFDKKSFEFIQTLHDTDIVFSGHVHNGLIPCYVDNILPGNFGFFSYTKLFPQNVRGRKQITDNTVGFISSPITTFADHYGIFQKLNALYPPVEQKVLIKKY